MSYTSKSPRFDELSLGGEKEDSAILEVQSTTKGSKPWPSMTSIQRNNIASPQPGLVVYNTTDSELQIYNGTWQPISNPSSGGLIVEYQNSNFTTSASRHYLVDTSSNTITATLPSGFTGAVIRFSDTANSWNTNTFSVAPASGESIEGDQPGIPKTYDGFNDWVQYVWDDGNNVWAIDESPQDLIGALGVRAGDIGLNGITGRFDGVQTPFNIIGGGAEDTSSSLVTATVKDAWVDTGAELVLTAGNYRLFASLSWGQNLPSPGGGTLQSMDFRIQNITDNITISSRDFVGQTSNPAGERDAALGSCSLTGRVSTNTSKTFRLQFRGVQLGATNVTNVNVFVRGGATLEVDRIG